MAFGEMRMVMMDQMLLLVKLPSLSPHYVLARR